MLNGNQQLIAHEMTALIEKCTILLISIIIVSIIQLMISFQKIVKNIDSPKPLLYHIKSNILLDDLELDELHDLLHPFTGSPPGIHPSIHPSNSLTRRQQDGKVAACPQVKGSCKTQTLPLLGY